MFLHSYKKISLFAVSLALVFVLMNIAPQVASDSGTDVALPAIDQQDTSSPAAALPPPHMVAYWELNELGGTVVHDSVEPVITGNTYGGPIWPSGVAGNCLELRPNQYVEFNDPNHYLFLPEIISIEAWINPTDLAGQKAILVNSNNPASTQFYFGLRDGRLHFRQSAGTPPASPED